MNADLSALPERIELAVGDRVAVALPSFAGSGNVWSVAGSEDERVAQAVVEVTPADASMRGDGMSEPPSMQLAAERAVVTGLAPGETTLRFVLARPFRPSPATSEHVVHVTVVLAIPAERMQANTV